jgi:uncharacterized membrane protein
MDRLVVLGLLLMAAGFIVVAVGSSGSAGVSTGGFVLIGPIPIVFGSGTNGTQLAALSAMLGVLTLVLVLVMAFRSRSLMRKGEEANDK